MTDILDNENVLQQKDPAGALRVTAEQFRQVAFQPEIIGAIDESRRITSIVVSGMGGSALAALIAKTVLANELSVSFEVIREYTLPAYVGPETLVIASSYSGNTEETITSLKEAVKRGAQVAVIASGGELIRTAVETSLPYTTIPSGIQPRMAVLYNLKGLFALLRHFGCITESWEQELASLSGWLETETAAWIGAVSSDQNVAKQLALRAVGKTPVFYGTPLTASLAYKWKISWNENAKNTAFWNQYPEFNHNEFIGWTSHPIEKPFAIFDFRSSFDAPRNIQRMELSDQLLSGKRPRTHVIELKGETLLAQLVWGSILADFASIYTAILNGVDPTPVALIERFKTDLAAKDAS